MKKLVWRVFISLFFALPVLAQQGDGIANGGITRGNFLRVPDYRTPGTGAQSYFVDPTGADTNACTASGASACLTIQGAINKIPKLLRDQVTVNVAAGNYTGFIVSGFRVDYGIQQTTGGLLIDGSLVNSTLATGSATGVATGGTAGAGGQFGTLIDTGATWTVNDLVGRFISTTGPTNSVFVIDSNTATTITIVGFWTAPTAGSTYTIQDPSVIINAGVSLPATPVGAVIANRAGIEVFGNDMKYAANPLVIRSIRVATSSTQGVEINDSITVRLTQMQIRPSLSTANGVNAGQLNSANFAVASLTNDDIAMSPSSTSGIATVVGTGGLIVSNTLFRNIGTGIGDTGVSLATGGSNIVTSNSFFASDITGFENGIRWMAGSINSAVGNLKGNHITCADSAGVGFSIGTTPSIGGSATTQAGVPIGVTSVLNFTFATCGIGVQVSGGAMADISQISGTVATTGIAVNTGSLVTFSAGLALTSSGTEINIDSGRVTASFADVVSGCLASAGYASRACVR